MTETAGRAPAQQNKNRGTMSALLRAATRKVSAYTGYNHVNFIVAKVSAHKTAAVKVNGMAV